MYFEKGHVLMIIVGKNILEKYVKKHGDARRAIRKDLARKS
jgi:hypothetical protein